MVDYRINLVKTVVSTPEQRQKFYHGMLIYLSICAAAMVYVAYLTSWNLIDGISAIQSRSALTQTQDSVSRTEKAFYRNPELALKELKNDSKSLGMIKQALSGQADFLPVISQLFMDIPKGAALQNLTTSPDRKKITFGIIVPLSDQDHGDPVRELQTSWSNNKNLMKRVHSIHPVTGERKSAGGVPVFAVKFECVLK